jgi:hypothetical protein
MSDSYQKAQNLLSSSLSKVKSGMRSDGTQIAQAENIPRSKYAGSSTGTMYGANVDTAGNKPPQLDQVGTKTKKSYSGNPFSG